MFELSQEGLKFVRSELTRYETKRSAVIPCLYRVQQENNGWVSAEAISYLADLIEIPEVWIREVLDFYSMFNKRPVGQYHAQVCGNVSCAMNGGLKICKHLRQVFAVQEGQVSRDGLVSVSKVECLGSCDGAPMMQVNDKNYTNLTPEKAEQIVKDLIQE